MSLIIGLWNCGGAGNMQYLLQKHIPYIFCLQETNIYHDFFSLTKTTLSQSGGTQAGTLKLGGISLNCHVWENKLQTNGKDIAIAWRTSGVDFNKYKSINCVGFGSPSMSRSLPGINITYNKKDYNIFSIHSVSSGENTSHADDIELTVQAAKELGDSYIIAGDFNYEVDEIKKKRNDVVHGNKGSRPFSKTTNRLLDYCITNAKNDLSFIDAELPAGSDHNIQYFKLG